MAKELPSRAQVVVIGGGVIGTSVAYHLTELGWTDVVLLEQGELSSGTTWHAAGLVGQLRANQSGTRLVQYSTELYARLEDETGLSTGYQQCGGVTVARTEDRMTQLRRTAATAEAFDLECELLTPEEAEERYPVMRVDDLVGAIWLPGDGKANPTDLTAALARGRPPARRPGLREDPGARRRRRGRAASPACAPTPGDIEAEVVVNCAGQWAKAVGAMAGVNVPLHSAEHFYVVTEPFEGVHPDLPVLRDPDGYTYFKEEVGGLVVGGFEPEAKPWVSPDQIPYPFEFQLLEEDWEHFSLLMENALLRVPALEETGIRKFYNGPESFTPDNQFILGEAPEVAGFFVGAGFNSVGIASAGGAGRALAEWIVEGEPTSDLTSVDVRRFARLQRQRPVAARPRRRGARPALRDPVAQPRDAHGAAVPSLAAVHHLRGGERQLRQQDGLGARQLLRAGGGVARHRLLLGQAELAALVGRRAGQHPRRTSRSSTRRRSRSTSCVGPDAESALQWLCTADVDVPVGRTVYTGMLNERGTYESDVTVTRVADDEYLIVSSAATTERDQDHIRRHVGDRRVTLVDVTSPYAVFGVMGPTSRELLSRPDRRRPVATRRSRSAPAGRSRLGHATVRATRITYVGELGWELYVPAEFAVGVYEDLLEHRRRPRRRQRRLLRDRLAAAGEGLPRVRPRAHPRLRTARGRA